MALIFTLFAVLLISFIPNRCYSFSGTSECNLLNSAINRIGRVLFELNLPVLPAVTRFSDIKLENLPDDQRFKVQFGPLLGNLSEIYKSFRIKYVHDERTETQCQKQILKKLAQWLTFFVRIRRHAIKQFQFKPPKVPNMEAVTELQSIAKDPRVDEGVLKLILLLEAADDDRLAAFQQHCREHDPFAWLDRLNQLPALFEIFNWNSRSDDQRISEIRENFLNTVIYRGQIVVVMTAACAGLPKLTELQYKERFYSSDFRIRKAVASIFNIKMIYHTLKNYIDSVVMPQLIAQDSDPHAAAETLLNGLNEKFPWAFWSVYGSRFKKIEVRYIESMDGFDNSTAYNVTYMNRYDFTQNNMFFVDGSYLSLSKMPDSAEIRAFPVDGRFAPITHEYVAVWSYMSDEVFNWNKSPYGPYLEVFEYFSPNCSRTPLRFYHTHIFNFMLINQQPWAEPSFVYMGEKASFFHRNGRMMTLDVCNDYVAVLGN